MDPVGTTLGVLGLAGLLSVCLDCFHYIQDGRSLGQDFAFLEGQLSAHGIPLYAWAHACGFTRSDGRYDRRLDSPVWQQHIRTQLNAIALLFLDANKIVRHYGLGGDRHAPGQVTACLIPDSPNAHFINDGLCGYLARIRATKTRAGLLGALSWALVHKGELTRLVGQLRQCIEALELVTKNLDLFEAGRRVVEAEIETMTDAESLWNMIAVPGSSDADSDVVSDAASQRLLRIGSAENRASSISETSVTAQTWPDTDFRAIAETDEPEDSPAVRGAVREAPEERERPQHVRIMASVIARADDSSRTPTQPIALSERHWGDKLAPLRARDIQVATQHGFLAKTFKFPVQGRHALHARAARESRIRRELCEILQNESNSSSFLTARLLEFSTAGNSRIRLSSEGPPQSPYSGGIFHLISEYDMDYPFSPLRLRFLTRIYHPNIDAHGNICMNVLTREGSQPFLCTAAVIVGLLSVLSDPTVDDPLVPEIATTYVQDRQLYEQNDRAYTLKFAGVSQCLEAYGVTPDMFEGRVDTSSTS